MLSVTLRSTIALRSSVQQRAVTGLRGICTRASTSTRFARVGCAASSSRLQTRGVIHPQRLFSSTTLRRATHEAPVDPTPNAVEETPWIDVLEKSASGPWTSVIAGTEQERLQVCHSLLAQTLMYLSRTMNDQGAEAGAQYLSAFQNARVPPSSEMSRARTSIAKIAQGVVHQILSIPLESKIRLGEGIKDEPGFAAQEGQPQTPAHIQIFQAAEMLKEVNDEFIGSADPSSALTPHAGQTEDGKWAAYWEKAQPCIIAVFDGLERGGLAIQFDDGEA